MRNVEVRVHPVLHSQLFGAADAEAAAGEWMSTNIEADDVLAYCQNCHVECGPPDWCPCGTGNMVFPYSKAGLLELLLNSRKNLEDAECERDRLHEILLTIEGVHHECDYRKRNTSACASCTVAEIVSKGLRP